MREEDLSQHNIHVESVQHLHGSPHGQYWGYLVVKQEEHSSIYFGRSKKSTAKQYCDAFPSRWRALRFAKSLAGDSVRISEEQACEFDHLWVDHGGEG